jgi:hypothetical protein
MGVSQEERIERRKTGNWQARGANSGKKPSKSCPKVRISEHADATELQEERRMSDIRNAKIQRSISDGRLLRRDRSRSRG